MNRRLVPALVAIALAVAGVGQTRADGEGHFLATRRYEDIYYLPPPSWLRLGALGHTEALAGLIWLKALVYFGEDISHKGGAAHVYHYADAILSLDPYFKRAYRWAASSALYRPVGYTAEDAKRAIGYLERGVRLFPDDGELAWHLGATYAYELPPLLADPAEREQARAKALEHLRVASIQGAGPPWLTLTTATAMERHGRREQQIRYLEEVYHQTSDPMVRQELENRLMRLKSESHVTNLRAAHAELEARRRRDYPFLDADLYLLVGPKPPFDGEALMMRGFDPAPEHFQSAADQPTD